MNRFKAVSKLIIDYDCKIVAEIGVHEGLILQNILNDTGVNAALHTYFLIDFWRPHPPEGPQSVEQWDEWCRRIYKDFFFHPKVNIIRLSSLQAATLFPDDFFDMVYIDACHKEYAVREDVKEWNPKVKKGGIVSGHDWHLERVRKPVYEFFGEEKVKVIKPTGREVGSWYVEK